jgi:hypothetical protein
VRLYSLLAGRIKKQSSACDDYFSLMGRSTSNATVCLAARRWKTHPKSSRGSVREAATKETQLFKGIGQELTIFGPTFKYTQSASDLINPILSTASLGLSGI